MAVELSSDTYENTKLASHLSPLRLVARFRIANLNFTVRQRAFCKRVGYLDHLVTLKKREARRGQNSSESEFPIPKTTKQIKSFLGLLGYYKNFIKKFELLTKPLTKRLNKGTIKYKVYGLYRQLQHVQNYSNKRTSFTIPGLY